MDEMKLVRIADVTVLEGTRVRLGLTDGRVIERELGPVLVGGVFEEIVRNPERFAEVFVQDGALSWPNGADLCPDVVIWGGMPPADSVSDAA